MSADGRALGARALQRVVSNHWTGLWTGFLYWTDGMDYWINNRTEFVLIT